MSEQYSLWHEIPILTRTKTSCLGLANWSSGGCFSICYTPFASLISPVDVMPMDGLNFPCGNRCLPTMNCARRARVKMRDPDCVCYRRLNTCMRLLTSAAIPRTFSRRCANLLITHHEIQLRSRGTSTSCGPVSRQSRKAWITKRAALVRDCLCDESHAMMHNYCILLQLAIAATTGAWTRAGSSFALTRAGVACLNWLCKAEGEVYELCSCISLFRPWRSGHCLPGRLCFEHQHGHCDRDGDQDGS